jgi:phosphoadenosine phosphosulfate reductase
MQPSPVTVAVDDSTATIWRNDAFHHETWVRTVGSETLPDAPVVLSKAQWSTLRDQLDGRTSPLGLRLEPGEVIDDIAADLPRFALVALSFPRFSDGRPFSTARLLRERFGYRGELRAVGNVLADQIPFMRRVGFDSYEVTNAPTRRALAEGRIADVTLHYQPTGVAEPHAGPRPWLRRSPA